MTFASSELVQNYPEELKAFLLALALESGIRQVGFSDDSCVSDFCLDDEQIDAISERLGVPVSASDYVLDVCQRLLARKEVN
jgi:hypothetical protein